MKKRYYWLSPLLLAGWVGSAHAQDVWAYQVILPNNEVRITAQPPRDLTYPPRGVATPILYGKDQGVVLTPQEAAARRNAPQLVIMLIPAQLAERTTYSSVP